MAQPTARLRSSPMNEKTVARTVAAVGWIFNLFRMKWMPGYGNGFATPNDSLKSEEHVTGISRKYDPTDKG